MTGATWLRRLTSRPRSSQYRRSDRWTGLRGQRSVNWPGGNRVVFSRWPEDNAREQGQRHGERDAERLPPRVRMIQQSTEATAQGDRHGG